MDRVPSNTVNAFQIKRQAHILSRNEDSLNPFRHVWRTHQRSQTWDAEAQRGDRRQVDVDEAGTSPIEQIRTAPAGSHIDLSNLDRTSKEQEADGYHPERTESSGDTVVPSQGTAEASGFDDAANSLRNRRGDRDLSATNGDDERDEKKPKKEHRMFKHIEPKEPFTFANQIQRTFLNSWINVLLIAAPVGIILGAIPNMNKYAIFVVNFIAIIPLAAMLSFATEEIALRTGETLGGLLNASFG